MSGPYICDKCGVEYGKHIRGRVDDLEDEVAAIKAFLVLP